MTDKVTKPRQRKKRDPKPSALIREDVIKEKPITNLAVRNLDRIDSPSTLQLAVVPNPNPVVVSRPTLEGDDALTAIRWRYKLPMLFQPSQQDIFDTAFISHFVELNRGVRSQNAGIPWISRVPDLHNYSIKPALRLSIRAASMAFYSQVHQDVSVLTDSYRWYMKGLNYQRQSISSLDGNSIPSDDAVLVPIILGLYEVYAGTTPTSVFHHLAAATKILQMRGPSNCSSGVSLQLFKAMRVSDAHKSLIFNRPSPLSTPEWLTLPFIVHPKNAHHCLTDILLAIPACIGLCGRSGSLADFFSRPIPHSADLQPTRQRTKQLLRDIDDWAERYPHLCYADPIAQIVNADMSTSILATNSSNAPKSPSLMLPDTFTALTAATFYATRLTLILLRDKISSPPVSPNIARIRTETVGIADAISHSISILQVAAFIESTHPVGFDFMRSVFPLVVVGLLGPQEHEQNLARNMLVRWGERRGVGGLCGSWVHI
ncbi:uncharacterized protein BDR25DRAFT_283707 [Lindgomyces ingoldianus]|uniref:Uncharacterized protein n=1 Tax=Lindgomyces ingoldianus TaxID=673940 RepID=A0ACB6R0J4_9PLEO|nr:uncharacterized protein BDR25DRAFT_283707 [Lindgomyces ingoldianus]KAF2472315.1 hypothetical protein BDR25DRAFT_283707 [Lindgomyces ingoldianus]